jgi:hypothetical protein
MSPEIPSAVVTEQLTGYNPSVGAASYWNH